MTSAQEALRAQPGATVYHMDLRINEDLSRVNGRLKVRYTNRSGQGLDELVFRLFPNIFGGKCTVQILKVDGRAVEPVYGLRDSVMRAAVLPSLPPGESVVVEMDFVVEAPVESQGNYGIFGRNGGVLDLAYFYPQIPAHRGGRWQTEIPQPYGDVTFTESSFYRARLRVPAGVQVVSSAAEVAHTEADGWQTIMLAGGPQRDFYLAAGADFIVLSRQVGETTVNSYAPAGAEEGAQSALEYTAAALQFFNDAIGEYPFTKLDVIAASMSALGIEYPAVFAMAAGFYQPGQSQLFSSREMFEATIAHEVAHQWFYGVVGNDQPGEPWLDESLVQYLTMLYFQDRYGAGGYETFRGTLLSRWERVGSAPIPIGLAVRQYSSVEYGAIVYGRGALFFEALARQMGAQSFDLFLRRYYQRHKWGIATGESLKETAEKACGCDLDALFEEWVYN